MFDGRFQILEKLGEGATGDVHKVKDTVLNRQAAIKLLRFRNNEKRKVLRFQREAKASSKLKHSGLIEVYDFGITDDGTPYLVMELIEGDSLESILKNSGSSIGSGTKNVVAFDLELEPYILRSVNRIFC